MFFFCSHPSHKSCLPPMRPRIDAATNDRHYLFCTLSKATTALCSGKTTQGTNRLKYSVMPLGVPAAPYWHAQQFMQGKPHMRLVHMTASLVGFMRVRRHSHHHA